jgi:hypothetical protein
MRYEHIRRLLDGNNAGSSFIICIVITAGNFDDIYLALIVLSKQLSFCFKEQTDPFPELSIIQLGNSLALP